MVGEPCRTPPLQFLRRDVIPPLPGYHIAYTKRNMLFYKEAFPITLIDVYHFLLLSVKYYIIIQGAAIINTISHNSHK